MTEPGRQWSANFGAAAADAVRVYDEVLVPRLFDPWGELLLDALSVGEGEALLDVACGPGTVARLAARRLGPTGRVTGVDLSPAMLARAAAKPAADGSAPIDLREGPAERLPVDDGAFDVATCQHGLQFFPDRPAALAEIRRALRPGGRLGIAVWTAVEHSPPFAAIADAVGAVLGPPARAAYAGGPWGFADGTALQAVAAGAGFADVELRTLTRPVTFDDPTQLTSTAAVSPLGPQLHGQTGDRVVAEVASRIDAWPLRSTVEAHLLLARA